VQVDPIKPKLKPPEQGLESKVCCTTFTICFHIQLAPLHQDHRVRAAAVRPADHRAGLRGVRWGGAAQVDPINPMLKASGTKRLKLKYNVSPSNCAFKSYLRRYAGEGNTDVTVQGPIAMVGQFRLTVMYTNIGSLVYGYRVRFVQI